MGYDKPLPKVNSDNRLFWEGCRDHELKFQRCKECSHIRWPCSIICPKCYSRETEWIVAGGQGTIYTHAVYHIAYHTAFTWDIPYVVAIVELDEGPHILTNIVGCKPEQVSCGMGVTVVWDEVTPEVTLPKFRPDK